jgi:hypothetical protein
VVIGALPPAAPDMPSRRAARRRTGPAQRPAELLPFFPGYTRYMSAPEPAPEPPGRPEPASPAPDREPGPGGPPPPAPDLPEPDIPSPLHPEAPGRDEPDGAGAAGTG